MNLPEQYNHVKVVCLSGEVPREEEEAPWR